MTEVTQAHDEAPDDVAESILAGLDAESDEPSPESETPPSDAPGDAQEPDDSDAAPADASTEPPAEAQGDEPPADSETPPEPEVSAEPFAFTVDAKRVAVDGATVSGDTITLSREAWQRQVQPHLADRAKLARDRQVLEQRLQQKSVAEHQAAQLVDMLRGVANLDEDQAIEWALGLKAKMPMMLKDAEIAALQQQQQPLQALAQDRDAQVTLEQVAEWRNTALHAYLDTPEFRDVKTDQRFLNRAQRQLELATPLLLREGRDAAGQPAVEADWERFHAILKAEADDARELQSQTKRLKEIEAAQRANATAAKAIPPAVSARGKPTGATKTTKPQTREQYDELMDKLARGEIDI